MGSYVAKMFFSNPGRLMFLAILAYTLLAELRKT